MNFSVMGAIPLPMACRTTSRGIRLAAVVSMWRKLARRLAVSEIESDRSRAGDFHPAIGQGWQFAEWTCAHKSGRIAAIFGANIDPLGLLHLPIGAIDEMEFERV